MSNRDIGNLRTRLSWEDEDANKSLEGFKRDLRGLRSEMNLARSGGREFSTSLKGMRQQSDILTRTFRTQEERVKELRNRYNELTKAGKEDTVQAKELASQINNATAEMNRTEAQLKRLNDEVRRMESPWTKIGENMTATGQKMQDFGRSMSDFGRSYTMRVTAPIVAGAGAVFKASMDYESAFAGVRKTVDATEEEFQALSDGIREMTGVLPASATEIAAVGEAAGQLGIETENILSFTRTMMDLGEATNMTAEGAATEFARFANIVGMSQKDFDRLGSVVVDLGNNLATTEGEIVEMGLRLAGAGAQIGLTESQIMAFAGSLSSVGIAAEAGGSAFSKVMVNMQLAAELGGEDLKAFAKVAQMSSSDFKKAFEDDAAGAMIAFIKGLETAEERGMSAIAVLDEMGITEVRMRDALLRAAGASDVFTDAIAMGSVAWEENVALTEEAEQRYETTESQLRIMWNRMKDMAITMGDAVVPAIMDTLDAVEPLIDKIESGAQAFADMDEEQQKTILKFIGLAAAVGPATIGLGAMSTSIGGVIKMGGGLATTLGKAGTGGAAGAGLLGGIGRLAALATSPVGLAIAGVGLLAGGIYLLTRDTEKLNDVNYELIDSVDEEVASLKDLETRFTDLHGKTRLSADEMLRYMDIMTELESAESEQAIKALSDEQEELLRKSGLTNDEMEEFLSLNNQIVDETPNVTSAISDQGNAFIDNLDILKDLNAEKIEGLMIDAQRELEKALENENTLLQRQIDLANEIEKIQEDINTTQADRLAIMPELTREQEEQRRIDQERRDIGEQLKDLDGQELKDAQEKYHRLEDQLVKQNEIVNNLEQQKGWLDEQYDQLRENLDAKNDSLETTKEELEQIESLIGDYEVLILKQVGLNSAKGEGVDTIDMEIRKQEQLRDKLEETTDEAFKNTDEYRNARDEITKQIGRLEEAKRELKEINTLAGQTVYDKTVNIRSNPSLADFNRNWSGTLHRTVRINPQVNRGAVPIPSYAAGTNYHPGGNALVGEEGFELAKLGSRWSMLDFGITNLARGTQVFTHDESKGILKALNNMPAYASGISASGEANRIVNRLNNQSFGDSNGQVVGLLRQIATGIQQGNVIQIDGRVITKVVNENNAINQLANNY